MATFTPGQVLFCQQGTAPWFVRVEVIEPAGRLPHLDRMQVRYLEQGQLAAPGETRSETAHRCFPDSPQLRAWWQARADYANLVSLVISISRERGIPYFDDRRMNQLPEVQQRDQAWQRCQALEHEVRAAHPMPGARH